MSTNDTLRKFLENCGVKKGIVDLLLKLFPAGSFLEYLPLFKEAIEKPET